MSQRIRLSSGFVKYLQKILQLCTIIENVVDFSVRMWYNQDKDCEPMRSGSEFMIERMECMKITTINPLILSPSKDAVTELFEALGFAQTHSLVTDVEGFNLDVTRMKNEGGFHVDVADVKAVPQDFTIIRMNVDNFDEAYAILKEHGFVNLAGEDTSAGTKSARAATLAAPSGFQICLIEHLKK